MQNRIVGHDMKLFGIACIALFFISLVYAMLPNNKDKS
jgi:hypothetical protein